jgi:TonB family protein
MSTLSPGSKATTNLFMVLGVITLIALAVSVSRKQELADEELSPAALCKARFISMGSVVWDPYGPVIHPGDSQPVTLAYTVTPEGRTENISVVGTSTQYDEVAITAAQKARYAPDPEAKPVACGYNMTLRLD